MYTCRRHSEATNGIIAEIFSISYTKMARSALIGMYDKPIFAAYEAYYSFASLSARRESEVYSCICPFVFA